MTSLVPRRVPGRRATRVIVAIAALLLLPVPITALATPGCAAGASGERCAPVAETRWHPLGELLSWAAVAGGR